MRWFVRKSIKGGQVCAFNQNYKSKTCCDEKIKLTSEELNVKGKNYGIVEAYLSYKNIYLKIFGKENENQLNDYRDRDLDEKREYQKKLSQLPIHQLLKQVKLDEILWDFDAVSLNSCGTKIVFILGSKQDMLIQKIWITDSQKIQ